MPSLINEHTQYVDSAGVPLASGKVYIGTQNLNPVSNPITIYSDRDLTTTISNPQTLDANGRTTNKIWVPGRYSIQVDNSADVQQYQELDTGEINKTGIIQLTNVAGTNTITAEGTPTAVTTLTNGDQYNFVAANSNTGAVTLQIDLTTAKAIKKLHDIDLATGEIEQNQVVAVVYNSTDDVFELVSNTASASFDALTANTVTINTSATLAGAGLPFPAGTAMLFYQSAAPTGWTRDVTAALDDHALRIVTSGTWTGGTQGTSPFSTVFGLTATNSHTLTSGEMPVHNHSLNLTDYWGNSDTGNSGWGGDQSAAGTTNRTVTNAGSGSGHSHNIELRVKYLDIIIASKD